MKYSMICLLCLLPLMPAVAKSDETSALATVENFLNSETTDAQRLHEVNMACLELTRVGTENAIPAMQKLLGDERFSTVARSVLTNIPGDAGVEALRKSLDTLEGQNLLGVVQTLGAVRDAKSVLRIIEIIEASDNVDLRNAGFYALGNIASADATDYLMKALAASDDAAAKGRMSDIALVAADRIRQNGDTKKAAQLYEGILQHGAGTFRESALLALMLLDEEKGHALLIDLLKNKQKAPFKIVQCAVLEMQSAKTGTLVLDNMGDLPVEQQAALIACLGAKKDTTVVTRLIDWAQDEHSPLRLAALQTIGEIGDVRGINALLLALGSADSAVAESARNGLKQLRGDDFDDTMIKMLDAKEKRVRLAALDVIGERQMASAAEKMVALFDDADTEIRAAAYRAFSRSVTPTVADIRLVLDHMQKAIEQKRPEAERNAIHESLATLCRKTGDRDAAVELFADKLKNADTVSANFYLELLFQIGGEKAGRVLAEVAMGPNVALCDKATQLLGRWTTPEVAPFLLEIAEKHPSQRYRIRTLSGYLRIVRQMGLPLEQKVQMAEKAVAVAERHDDKQRAAELFERFQTMMKGRPIFDGATFDGWEFRANESLFRIEERAIVAGTLEKPIVRNEFITTQKEYGDFTLRIECKALGKGANAGVQFRSVRAPADGHMPNEMIGYQADMTDDAAYWGSLYDESRRNRFLAQADHALVESVFRPNDWNEYEIVCKGKNIKIFLNGTLTVDYTETDDSMPARGVIGLQIHGGPASEAWYRNIRVEEP